MPSPHLLPSQRCTGRGIARGHGGIACCACPVPKIVRKSSKAYQHRLLSRKRGFFETPPLTARVLCKSATDCDKLRLHYSLSVEKRGIQKPISETRLTKHNLILDKCVSL